MTSIFSIKLRHLRWIYKDKTYNGWNDIGGRSAMGEGLQWFFSTIADLPGGRSAIGGKVCNITPVSLHLLVCQTQNCDQWWIMVPALQICKELENPCPTLRDMGNEICVVFVKMKSWQNAKFLELSAPEQITATMSIPINFDHTISKCYYVQLQLLLAFHIINI